MIKDRKCDICGTVPQKIVDGKTRQGPWGMMCRPCHKIYGVGLGTGRGQLYDNRTGEKLEG